MCTVSLCVTYYEGYISSICVYIVYNTNHICILSIYVSSHKLTEAHYYQFYYYYY